MSLILQWFIRSKMTPQGWFPYKYAEIQILSIANGCYWGVWPTWCLQRAALLWAQRQKEKLSLQGVAIWERDIPVHSWPWEIPGMFKSGCEETRVIEKTFLIKSINLMGSQRHFAASYHCHSSLTHCCDPPLHEGAAVAALWVEGDALQNFSVIITAAKNAFHSLGMALEVWRLWGQPTLNGCSHFQAAGWRKTIFGSCPMQHSCFLNSSPHAAEVGYIEIHLMIWIHFLLLIWFIYS